MKAVKQEDLFGCGVACVAASGLINNILTYMVYLPKMHKDFYASGFLYHRPTEQILLQQPLPSDNGFPQPWILFGGKNHSSEDTPITFRRIIREQLHHTLPTETIYPIYDYFNRELNQDYYMQYSELKTNLPNLYVPKGYTIEWFTFKQLTKISLTEQTRQDIIVGQRVIDAAFRNQSHAPAEEFITR